MVKQIVKSVDALPDRLKSKDLNTLDMMPVSSLPENLQKSVLRQHHLEQLKSQIKNSENTTAAPWLYFLTANLSYQDGQIEEAQKWNEKLFNKFPHHFLTLEAMQNAKTIEQSLEWQKKNFIPKPEFAFSETEATKEFVLKTTRGQFKIALLAKRNSKAVEAVSDWVSAGFYNGLTFYKTSAERIYTGCSIGNGMGGMEAASLDTKDVYMQRGLVVMDKNEDHPEKMTSRFYILKKYPFGESLQRCSVWGVVSVEGMEVVDKLENNDIILDTSIIAKTVDEKK